MGEGRDVVSGRESLVMMSLRVFGAQSSDASRLVARQREWGFHEVTGSLLDHARIMSLSCEYLQKTERHTEIFGINLDRLCHAMQF